jgi:ketosteroid isomerase-like protein
VFPVLPHNISNRRRFLWALHYLNSLTCGSQELSNVQDIEAAAAMYHPDARVVRLEQVHGSDTVAQGAEEIRETMAGYVGLKPHMDVVMHHTTVAGDFALCRPQWRITGTDPSGKAIEVHHLRRRLQDRVGGQRRVG